LYSSPLMVIICESFLVLGDRRRCARLILEQASFPASDVGSRFREVHPNRGLSDDHAAPSRASGHSSERVRVTNSVSARARAA